MPRWALIMIGYPEPPKIVGYCLACSLEWLSTRDTDV